METSLALEIEGFDASESVRDAIAAHVARLERHYGRITACRVAIHAPHAHHRQGEPYFISIRLTLPGDRDVEVSPPPGGLDRRQADLMFAIDDAFRRADRQLSDEAAWRKEHGPAHEREPRGKVLRLDPSGDFGFLADQDGNEVYFHAHSVVGGTFSDLAPGMDVAFRAEPGDKGLQARFVRIRG